MNYIPLLVKSDYSLLKSLIKINNLIKHAKENNLKFLSLCDENLYGSSEFLVSSIKNGIKPIIGLEVPFEEKKIYLFAKNYNGYKSLIKIFAHINNKEMNLNILKLYSLDLHVIIPYPYSDLYNDFNDFESVYLGYNNAFEKKNSLIITSNILYINEVVAMDKETSKYVNYLTMIRINETIDNYKMIDYSKNTYTFNEADVDDLKRLNEFYNLINIEVPLNKKYLPVYTAHNESSFEYLKKLCVKGLTKRLSGVVDEKYKERLITELEVIKEMQFEDYFLVVYDYVLHAKKSDIMVGPGRGSAAGSLVSYSLGITEIDPIKYNLLFERFLNKDRITMPDIDIDFEDTKRDLVKEYVRDKYGFDNVGNVMTYSTLSTQQVLIDLSASLNITDKVISFLKSIDSKLSLRENLKIDIINKEIKQNKIIKNLYGIALKLEGIKKHASIHPAALVVCPFNLDNLVPVYQSGNFNVIGTTMDYLEALGLLKMDFLGLRNLREINAISKAINDFNINTIPLDDTRVYEMLSEGDTLGVFQFESIGIKNFLMKLKPTNFEDLVSAIALYRPGPKNNIDSFIKRKHGTEKIEYLHVSLKPILENTYGVIIYQEQIMEILKTLAGYSYNEADLVRKSISKKKFDVLENEQKKFVNGCIKNNISEEISKNIFTLILKFAEYGFNKSHSVAYALISYQTAFLKSNYLKEYIITMLNMHARDKSKVKVFLDYALKRGLKVSPCNINTSSLNYEIVNEKIMMPLTIIKDINVISAKEIIENREDGYKDIFDFVSRNKLKENQILNLIYAGVFDDFNKRKTLAENLEKIMTYAELSAEGDSLLKPILKEFGEYNKLELLELETEVCGTYISDHPSIYYYKDNYVKVKSISKYFDKGIIIVGLVTKIKAIKTKKNDDMAFIEISDDTGNIECTLFANRIHLLDKIIRGKVVILNGKVTKRNDKYGILINNVIEFQNS